MKNYLYSSTNGCPTHSKYYNINQVLPICNCGIMLDPYCSNLGSGSTSLSSPSEEVSSLIKYFHDWSLTQTQIFRGWTYEQEECRHRKYWTQSIEEVELGRWSQMFVQRQGLYLLIPWPLRKMNRYDQSFAKNYSKEESILLKPCFI